MKNYKSFIFIIVVILALFAACGTVDNNTNNNTNENNIVINNSENNTIENNDNNEIDEADLKEIDQVDLLEKKYKVSYMGKSTAALHVYENPFVLNHLSEKFNIELSCPPVNAYDKEGIDLMVTSGTLPDCGWVGSGVATDLADKYYLSGATRSIPVDILKEYAPIFYESIEKNKYATLLHSVSIDIDDEFLCLYSYRYNYDKIGTANVVRYDWIKNLNYTYPGEIEHLLDFYYVTPKALTISEFADLAYEFTYSDPNMTGEGDTYGYQAYSTNVTDHAYVGTLMSAYQLTAPYMVNESNWAVPVEYSDGVKIAYEKVNEWLDLGIINIVISGSLNTKVWNSGVAGMRCSPIWRINEYVGGILSYAPEVELLIMPGLTDDNGDGGRTISYEIFEFSPSSGFFFVNKNVDDDKLKRILMLYDYLCISPEGYVLCNYGIEGIHWEYDKSLDMVALDQSNLPDDEQIVRYGWETPGTPKAISAGDPDRIAMDSMMFKYSYENWPATSNSYIVPPKAMDLDMEISWFDRPNKVARVGAQNLFIKKVFNEQVSIDVEWDNLMNVLDNCGYDGYITEINTKGYLLDDYMDGILIHPIDVYPID